MYAYTSKFPNLDTVCREFNQVAEALDSKYWCLYQRNYAPQYS